MRVTAGSPARTANLGPIVVGVTGHRILDLEQARERVERAFDLIEECYPGRPLVVISQLAEGADRLVPEVALSRGATVVALLPLSRDEFIKDFATDASRHEFENLLKQASEVIEPSSPTNRPGAYREAGIAMLERSNVLMAIWDGRAPKGQGGTAEIVGKARERHMPLVWVTEASHTRKKPGREAAGSEGGLIAERLDPLMDAYERRDRAAGYFQNRRWQYTLFAVILGPLATMLLALQVVMFPEPPWNTVLIALELLALAVALALGFLQMGRSHRRWIEERLRAELLRRELFLRIARVGPYHFVGAHDLPQRVEQRLRLLDNDLHDPLELLPLVEGEKTYLAALEDSSQTPEGIPFPNLSRRVRQYREYRLSDQWRFFADKALEHARLARFFENASKVILTVALILAAVHLGLLTANSGAESEPLHRLLAFLALIAPTMGSAFVGVQSVLGSHRLSRSYRWHAHSLERIETALERLSTDNPAAALLFQRAVLEAEALLSNELQVWWLIVAPQVPRAGI